MTKAEMVDSIFKSIGITKKGAAALEAITTKITKELKKDNNIVITGFGTFKVSHRTAPYRGQSPEYVTKDQNSGNEAQHLIREP